MNTLFLYIEINGIFVILLSILLFNMGSSVSKTVDEKYFRNAIWLNIMVLIADTGTWIMDGRIFADTLWINKLVFFSYYVFTAMFVFTWAVYSAYKLRVNWRFVSKHAFLLSIPVFAAFIMSVASLWNGCLFEFDENGVYIRGNLFGVHTAILWIYLIVSLASVIRILLSERRTEMMKECMAIIVAVFFPVAGGVLQTVYYGLNTAWTGSCLSFVLVFISIQNSQITMDALTGVKNRGCFESNLRDALEKNRRDNLYLIMIDVNKFKEINDTYGHISGDKALVELGKCLKQIVMESKDDFLGRYGGDEFVMLCKRNSDEEIDKLAKYIKRKVDGISDEAGLGFNMTVSVGWAKYDSIEHSTAERFIDAADENMYEQKNMAKI